MTSNNSCVETPAAPEWLSELENRREKLKHSKLGHEVGAGAPCRDCGDKCPGLDLHFWRKVCRNCKCRKDLHMCDNDELFGWAQFDILGQVRSKPAFVKIKTVAGEPVQLEWVPPNTAPDIVSDYMEKLGTTKIPIKGSEAAMKRKQQLEFQVPPHDLDSTLCDTLSESETQQMEQYVKKIRENCVGQGNVIRVASGSARVNLLNKVLPLLDPLLNELLSSDKLIEAINTEEKSTTPKLLVAFSEPISNFPITHDACSPIFSPSVKQKLGGLNQQAVYSLVHNGPVYDKILAILKDKNFDISGDPKLRSIADFRKEYLHNPQYQYEVNKLLPRISSSCESPENINQSSNLSFNSPLPLKHLMKKDTHMQQHTPMRTIKFDSTTDGILENCGIPTNVNYAKDQVFAQIIKSADLQRALAKEKIGQYQSPVIISSIPRSPDFMDTPILSDVTKQTLKNLQVDAKIIQSALINGPYYNNLFKALDEKGVKYSACKILEPLKGLREELQNNSVFHEQVQNYVLQMPNSAELAYHSAMDDDGAKVALPMFEMQTSPGHFTTIPNIENMNMYPTVELSQALQTTLENLQLEDSSTSENGNDVMKSLLPNLQCHECDKTIYLGDVAVKVEHSGKNMHWHPECFKCNICHELLADLVYFFHGGQIFCGRDLAIKLKIPRCKACDELIFTKKYTAAEGATFHIKHFCCYHCDVPLAGQQYIPDEKSNMPLCLKCYDEYFAASCQRCQCAIGPTDQGVVWNKIHWHSRCFTCAGTNCGKSLIGGRFCIKQDLPYCSPACARSTNN